MHKDRTRFLTALYVLLYAPVALGPHAFFSAEQHVRPVQDVPFLHIDEVRTISTERQGQRKISARHSRSGSRYIPPLQDVRMRRATGVGAAGVYDCNLRQFFVQPEEDGIRRI